MSPPENQETAADTSAAGQNPWEIIPLRANKIKSGVNAGVHLPDHLPPERDRENVRGNHVILTCGELNVELAHFMQGSVTVATGDRVAVGDPLGKVGNSGNTTEPHLHIHAVDPSTGLGVPMTFDGRFPVRNSVFGR